MSSNQSPSQTNHKAPSSYIAHTGGNGSEHAAATMDEQDLSPEREKEISSSPPHHSSGTATNSKPFHRFMGKIKKKLATNTSGGKSNGRDKEEETQSMDDGNEQENHVNSDYSSSIRHSHSSNEEHEHESVSSIYSDDESDYNENEHEHEWNGLSSSPPRNSFRPIENGRFTMRNFLMHHTFRHFHLGDDHDLEDLESESYYGEDAGDEYDG